MQQNIYYKTLVGRQNTIKMALLTFFLGISSYPRLVMEVFLRRNMGERYFTLASALTVAVILTVGPFFMAVSHSNPVFYVLENNKLYYAFMAAFLFFSFLRQKEVKRLPSVFDFGRYSKSDGVLHPIFFSRGHSIRTVEIFLEPLPFLIAGIVLFFLAPLLSVLLIFCALVYSLSKSGMYMQGDHFVMDMIDKQIINEDLRETFVTGKESARGLNFRGKRPTAKEQRDGLVDEMMPDDDSPAEAF